jgi:hypothetical protein|tara:strand:+ start:240 stop:440 length:201 start_codon:yes stop_codon:yes gene_type:complete
MSKFKESLKTKIKVNPREAIKQLLDKESYADFEAALKDQSISSAAIGSTLREFGVQVSNMTIQRWR